MENLLPYVTGSGGALAVLLFWVFIEQKEKKRLNDEKTQLQHEYNAVSKEAIECITKVLERDTQVNDWRSRAMALLQKIEEQTRTRANG